MNRFHLHHSDKKIEGEKIINQLLKFNHKQLIKSLTFNNYTDRANNWFDNLTKTTKING